MTSSRAYSNNAIRRAMRSLLIIEGSAKCDNGELSLPQLRQVVLAQCKNARKDLLAAIRGHSYGDQAKFAAVRVQKVVRGNMQRSRALMNVRAATVIQKHARRLIAQRRRRAATGPSANAAAVVQFVGEVTRFLDEMDAGGRPTKRHRAQ